MLADKGFLWLYGSMELRNYSKPGHIVDTFFCCLILAWPLHDLVDGSCKGDRNIMNNSTKTLKEGGEDEK